MVFKRFIYLEVFDGFSSLSNDKSDLVAGDNHLEEATSSTTAASTVLPTHTGRPAVDTVSLVGDNMVDGGFCVTKNKFNKVILRHYALEKKTILWLTLGQ